MKKEEMKMKLGGVGPSQNQNSQNEKLPTEISGECQ